MQVSSCVRFGQMLAAVMALCACEDSSAKSLASQALDAGRADSGKASAAADAAKTPEDDIASRTKSLDLMRWDADALQRWQAATAFQIAYKTTACLGSCPENDLTLDQAGHLHFSGGNHAARPGTYDVTVPAAEAKALYQQLLDLHFLQLQDSYVSAVDGCLVVTDAPTYYMELSTPDDDKEVDYYLGCFIKGPAKDALTAISTAITDAPALMRFMTPREEPCRGANMFYAGLGVPPEGPSFVLHRSDDKKSPVGIVKFGTRDKYDFEATVLDCSGKELLKSEHVLHYGCGVSVLPQDASTFAWPGVDGGIHAALIGIANPDEQSPGEFSVKLLADDADLSQALHLGTHCGD